ncbi:MAG TPA: hypothetical protein V6D08_06375 [Candidatus Obscuribacterales bacterium]
MSLLAALVLPAVTGPLPDASWQNASALAKEVAGHRSSPVSAARPLPCSRTYRLWRLKNRTGDHGSPDAIVHIPKDFHPARGVRLVIYNHGLTNTVDETLRIWRLGRHMTGAPPGAVLVVPEWAANPHEYSSEAGPFHNPGFFRRMLVEIMSKVPELRATRLDDVEEIAIVAYSGGFRAAASEIYRNGLEQKIASLTLLDALYVTDHFDAWLKRNIRQLASNRKQYHNFFFDTERQSAAQYQRLRQMLQSAGLKTTAALYAANRPKTVLSAAQLSRHGIVYKHTTLTSPRLTPHQLVADVYFPLAMRAWNYRTGAAPRLALAK